MKFPRLNLANPPVIYTGVWLLALFLTSLRLTTNLQPINNLTLVLVLSNIASFWLIYLFLWPAYPKGKTKSIHDIPIEAIIKLNRFVKRLLIFWTVGIIFEIIYAQGVPLVWAFQGSGKTYIDFGIPTFHGLLNAIYFFSITALFLSYLVCKKKSVLFVIIIFLGWPVLAFARSVLMGAIFQMLAVYLVLYRVSLRSLIKLLVFVPLIIWIFGIIGDFRGTQANLSILVVEDFKQIFNYLPSGFLWFYIYLTAPINNVIINIEQVQPTYVPYYSIANLAPSAIRNMILPEITRPDTLQLVVENLNVSTFYAGYLSDFGVFGSFFCVVIMQFFMVIVYLYAKLKKIWAILAYSVLFQAIVFSVFYNLLSSQVYLIQIVIALYFHYGIKGIKIKRPVSKQSELEQHSPYFLANSPKREL